MGSDLWLQVNGELLLLDPVVQRSFGRLGHHGYQELFRQVFRFSALCSSTCFRSSCNDYHGSRSVLLGYFLGESLGLAPLDKAYSLHPSKQAALVLIRLLLAHIFSPL